MADENKEIAEDEGIDPIESVGLKATFYNNLVDRYFTKFYIDRYADDEQYIFIHTNGIIMCGFGKNNALLNQTIKSAVNMNKVSKISGKRKRK